MRERRVIWECYACDEKGMLIPIGVSLYYFDTPEHRELAEKFKTNERDFIRKTWGTDPIEVTNYY